MVKVGDMVVVKPENIYDANVTAFGKDDPDRVPFAGQTGEVVKDWGAAGLDPNVWGVDLGDDFRRPLVGTTFWNLGAEELEVIE